DKKAYQFEMKRRVEETEGLTLVQEVVEGLVVDSPASGSTGEDRELRIENGGDDGAPSSILHPPSSIRGVRVRGGAVYHAKAVIVRTGTCLQGVMHAAEAKSAGGRAGEGTTGTLSDSFRELGFELQRFKTGTPARINGRTIDYSVLEEQLGDEDPQPFSFL